MKSVQYCLSSDSVIYTDKQLPNYTFYIWTAMRENLTLLDANNKGANKGPDHKLLVWVS